MKKGNPNPNPATRFKSGDTNPHGKVGGIFDYRALAAIGTNFLETYTEEQILKMYSSKALRRKLTVAQCLVLNRIAEAIKKDTTKRTGRHDADWVMDRIVGKAKQYIEHDGIPQGAAPSINISVPTGAVTKTDDAD